MQKKIKEIIQTVENNIVIHIPDSFKGKKLEITILPLIEKQKNNRKGPDKSVMGILNKYADPKLIKLEKKAWTEAVKNKHGIR